MARGIYDHLCILLMFVQLRGFYCFYKRLISVVHLDAEVYLLVEVDAALRKIRARGEMTISNRKTWMTNGKFPI